MDGWRADLPDCVKLCSLWHGVFPRFVLEDLVMVHRLPVHHGESKTARLLSVSNPEKPKTGMLAKRHKDL